MNVRDMLLVALGGAAGAVARTFVGVVCLAWLGSRFPWGTLAVNVVGCLALGWIVSASTTSQWISPAVSLALGTGFLGAFTTFSTFGVQTIQAWQRAPWIGLANVLANLVGGILAAAVGMYLASRMFGKP